MLGSGLRLWGRNSHTAFGRVSFSSPGPTLPHGPGAALNHSPDRGVSLIPRWPISDSVGAPDSSLRRPNLSPLECEFSDLCWQIAHLQRCRSCREYISRVADAEPVPQVLHYYPIEIRASYMNPCVRTLLGKPANPIETNCGAPPLPIKPGRVQISSSHLSCLLLPCDVPSQLTSKLFLAVY